ncbi:hypothetical protein ACV229_15365 [Burkholderia sp. MR1-5-21]
MSIEQVGSFSLCISPEEAVLLLDGMAALLRERSVALKIAQTAARGRGRLPPDVIEFGLPTILHLARRIEERCTGNSTFRAQSLHGLRPNSSQ